jgi:hypothetical protein
MKLRIIISYQKPKEPPQSLSLHWYLCKSYLQEPIIDIEWLPVSIEGLNILADSPLTTHKQKPSSKKQSLFPGKLLHSDHRIGRYEQ